MNVLQEIRRANLQLLAKRHGGQSALARALGRKKEQINALCRTKPMGDSLAEAIALEAGLPKDWLDSCRAEEDVEWASESARAYSPASLAVSGTRLITIPRFDVAGSMGDGRLIPDGHADVVEQITVSADYLGRAVAYSHPHNLAIIAALGDSMTPTFNDCDLLLVDRGITEIRLDAIYVIQYEGQLYIKRIQRRPGAPMLMISDNKAYPPIEILNDTAGDLQILGRALMAWNARKL